MFRRVSLWVGCGLLLAMSLQASQASAQMGIGPGGYGLGFFNYGGNGYGNSFRIPYYSLYPPVYYSYPVARTYGYSPFAYPPGTITPAAPQNVAAVEYTNPFVQKSDNDRQAQHNGTTPAPVGRVVDNTISQPRMYYNSYVQAAKTASTK